MSKSYVYMPSVVCVMDTLGTNKSVQVIKVSWFSRSFYTTKYHLGPQLRTCLDYAGVLICSVHINRFHCIVLKRHCMVIVISF